MSRSNTGERAMMLIKKIDIAINRIAEALNRAQPPYSGKLSIKYVDEGSDLLTPIVVKLQVTRNKKYLPIRVPSTGLANRAAWKSSFSINYTLVKALLTEAEYLMKTRKEINIKLRQMRHWENMFCESHEKKVEASMETTRNLHDAVEDNLRGRTTRAAKEAEREELGIVTIIMENKHSAKNRHKRLPAKRPNKDVPEPGEE